MLTIDIALSVRGNDNAACLQSCLNSIFAETGWPQNTCLHLYVDGFADHFKGPVIPTEWQSRVSLHVSDANRGLAFALNHIIGKSKADYLFRIDFDDRLVSGFIPVALRILEKDTPALLASHAYLVRRGKVVGSRGPFHRSFTRRLLAPILNPFNHPGIIISTEAVRNVGGYPYFDRCQDWALWGLMIKRFAGKLSCVEICSVAISTDALKGRRNIRYFLNEVRVSNFLRQIGYFRLPTMIAAVGFRIGRLL